MGPALSALVAACCVAHNPTIVPVCSVMLREATEFLNQLKRAEKAISSMAAANVDAVSLTEVALNG